MARNPEGYRHAKAAWREERRAIMQMREQGMTFAAIGATLGLSRQRVHQRLRKAQAEHLGATHPKESQPCRSPSQLSPQSPPMPR